MRIRLKLAILVTVLALILLAGVGTLFLFNLRSGLQSSLDDALRTSADEVIGQVDSSSAGRADAPLRLADSYGQVVSTNGQVRQSTDNAQGQSLLTATQAATAARGQHLFDAVLREHRTSSGGSHGPTSVRVRVLALPSGRSGLVVAVATSREVIDDAVGRATRELLLVGAIVLLLTGPSAWLLTRAALRPVDRMRAQAAELQARDAGAGLSVPGTTDEISRLAETLNGLLSRLHLALERERSFVADAGHELRTPLTILRGELELARRPGRSHAELSATIEVAAEETERLVRLTEDLLVLAHDENAVPARMQAFDVVEVARAAAAGARSPAAARSITIRVEGASALSAFGHADRIRQAVDNLLSNAVRHARDGGLVCIDVRQRGTQVHLAVIDDGPGFAEDLLPHVFERFSHGDSARTRGSSTGGSGLGLAIVRTILEGHGGDAVATNRTEGPGGRVVLSWPVAEPR